MSVMKKYNSQWRLLSKFQNLNDKKLPELPEAKKKKNS